MGRPEFREEGRKRAVTGDGNRLGAWRRKNRFSSVAAHRAARFENRVLQAAVSNGGKTLTPSETSGLMAGAGAGHAQSAGKAAELMNWNETASSPSARKQKSGVVSFSLRRAIASLAYHRPPHHAEHRRHGIKALRSGQTMSRLGGWRRGGIPYNLFLRASKNQAEQSLSSGIRLEGGLVLWRMNSKETGWKKRGTCGDDSTELRAYEKGGTERLACTKDFVIYVWRACSGKYKKRTEKPLACMKN